MKVTEYIDEWRKDCEFDSVDLAAEALRVPRMHHKWSEYLVLEKLRYSRQKMDIEKLECLLEQYFGKELTTEELEKFGLPPYPDKKIMKTDIPKWVNNHAEIIEAKKGLAMTAEKIEYLKDIMKSIHNRGYLIKSAIDYRKFEAGSL